ncbi:MAG: GNAT family N-acetyltransferase [Flavobacteriales bacterium]|nr:GNAT family N-acetyltransferase [Flavobacteriales bacterium]
MYLDQHETSRLRFRALTEDDIEIWSHFLENNQLTRFFPKTGLTTVEHSVFWVYKQLNRYRNDRLGLHAIISKEDGSFIGQAGLLSQIVDRKDEVEVICYLFPEHQGKGYASEIFEYLKDYAQKEQLHDSLVCLVQIENFPFQKLAERAGFVKERQTTYFDLDVFIFRYQLNSSD